MSFIRISGIAAAAAFVLTANTALAQGGYGALSYFDWSVDRSGLSKIESETVRATGGYMFSDTFGIEGHVATGGTDELQLPVGSGTEDAEAELNKMVAGFAKLNLPLLNKRANVYALAGYAFGKVDILAETTATTQSESGFSFGGGVEVSLVPDRLYLTLDHVEYVSQHDVDINATSLGVRLAFQ